MSAQALSALGAGFSVEAMGSQAVFRALLQALSLPGRPVEVLHDAQVPCVGHAASAAVLLALLDSDCALWLSPQLAASDAGHWLRFHTGCQLVDAPAQARFLWVAQGDAMPSLQSLAQGSDAYPDQSATCVLDVLSLTTSPEGDIPWRLTGPGIRDTQSLLVRGAPEHLAAQWADNHARFPRGVDVVLATAALIVGLPRTTCIHTLQEA